MLSDECLQEMNAGVFTAHEYPALFIKHVRTCSESGGRVTLLPHDGLDMLQLLEASAQAIAVVMGAWISTPEHIKQSEGMLVGAKHSTCTRSATAGEQVDIEVTCAHILGDMRLYDIAVLVITGAEEKQILTGELKVRMASLTEGVV